MDDMNQKDKIELLIRRFMDVEDLETSQDIGNLASHISQGLGFDDDGLLHVKGDTPSGKVEWVKP